MPKYKPLPTRERLKELFDYSPDSGILYRKKHVRGRDGGMAKVGTPNKYGYIRTKIDLSGYMVHRIAWKITTGSDPIQIDHIDGNKANNRLVNLRNVTHQQNQWNPAVRKDNTSGYPGVSYCNHHERWVVTIQAGKTQVRMGYYKCRALAGMISSNARALRKSMILNSSSEVVDALRIMREQLKEVRRDND